MAKPNRKQGLTNAFASANAAASAIGLHARFDLLYKAKLRSEIRPISTAEREYHIGLMRSMGYEQVCEAIAQGLMPVEIAMSNGIPLVLFREWLEQAPADMMARAMAAHAEVNVVKAELALSSIPLDKPTSDVQMALAAHYQWRAQKVDPVKWNPVKDTAPPAALFNFHLPANVPGLDHVRQPVTIDVPDKSAMPVHTQSVLSPPMPRHRITPVSRDDVEDATQPYGEELGETIFSEDEVVEIRTPPRRDVRMSNENFTPSAEDEAYLWGDTRKP